ncbi:hypothetical protein CTAYLR_007508 [Chrysophaeum taylorii]|uniref:Aminomethyltransferase n=1 Tax=Chrysophaeum taylorii TaxID=2483200 RepID=A0AAD7ULW3_9STRA|nr:hypothetical protein CTAYLR_007508 [Chrysophaeum taylorii]
MRVTVSIFKRTTTAVSRRFASGEPLIRTALYELHKDLKGKMVPFAGYELPVLYDGLGLKAEHVHCRTPGFASLFDVSHMGQIKWYGADRAAFIEKAVVGDVAGLGEGEAKLTLVVKDTGGIVDDAVLANAGDHVYMVVNGACKAKDMDHFKALMAENPSMDVTMEYMGDTEQALVALQGDGAKNVLDALLPAGFDLEKMAFMTGVYTTLAGYDVRVTRCGYTGEDGFEISMKESDALAISKLLLESTAAKVLPCGLGARDSLRLEAGLCLYGNDLNEDINPVEAALVWTLGPPGSRRRLEQSFIGASNFLTPEGKAKKMTKKRVGFLGHDKPARENSKIFDAAGEKEIGVITSGSFSPCLGVPIAMGYVDVAHAKNDTEVVIEVRGKKVASKVAKMPFVPSKYWRVPE